MSWLIVTWFLAFGYVPMQNEYIAGQTVDIQSDKIATVAQIGIDFEAFGRFHVFTDMENFQTFDTDSWYTGGAFNPYRIDYTFGASFDINDNVKIIATHECDHTVSKSPYNGYESGETKIMARINGKSEF